MVGFFGKRSTFHLIIVLSFPFHPTNMIHIGLEPCLWNFSNLYCKCSWKGRGWSDIVFPQAGKRKASARMSPGSGEARSWNPNTRSVRLHLGSVLQLTQITPYNRAATYSSAGYSWPGSGSLNTRRTKAKSMQSINILQQWKWGHHLNFDSMYV